MAEILEKKNKTRKRKKKWREGRKRDSRNTHLFLKDEVEDTSKSQYMISFLCHTSGELFCSHLL